MGNDLVDHQGEALAAQVRAEVRRLGLPSLSVRYVAERQVVRISSPRLGAAPEQGVEFPVSREGAERTLEALRAQVRAQRQAARSEVA